MAAKPLQVLVGVTGGIPYALSEQDIYSCRFRLVVIVFVDFLLLFFFSGKG